MKTKMNLKTFALIALLSLGLSLTACLGGRGGSLTDGSIAAGSIAAGSSAADVGGGRNEAAATEVAQQFLAACLAGDAATALDLLTADVRQAVVMSGGYPCSSVPAEAADALYLGAETRGQTMVVTHSWRRSTGETVFYRLLLREEEAAWRVFDVERDHAPPTPPPLPTPLSPPYSPPSPSG